MWCLLYETIKVEWAKPRTDYAFSNQLAAFFVLTTEWGGFFNTHRKDAETGTQGYDSYVSLLRFLGHPAQPILIAVTTDWSARFPEQYGTVRISVSPAAWIYRVTHGNPAVLKGVSMVLHSVTAHAMLQLYPQLREMLIQGPFEAMRTIVLEAAKRERFICKSQSSNLMIPLRDNPNFTDLWRRMAVAQMQCHLCQLAPVRVTCGACEGPRYCGDACADHDWRAHYKECVL
jgi:hypothetical protein